MYFSVFEGLEILKKKKKKRNGNFWGKKNTLKKRKDLSFQTKNKYNLYQNVLQRVIVIKPENKIN